MPTLGTCCPKRNSGVSISVFGQPYNSFALPKQVSHLRLLIPLLHIPLYEMFSLMHTTLLTQTEKTPTAPQRLACLVRHDNRHFTLWPSTYKIDKHFQDGTLIIAIVASASIFASVQHGSQG